MKNFVKIVSLLLVLCMVLPLAACGGNKQKEYDAPALVQSILTQVKFDDKLASVGDAAALYFADLPEGTKVDLYLGSGYFADEVALITLAKEKDMTNAKKSVDVHLAQIHTQFSQYVPAELGKIGNAVVWSSGKYIIVVITNAYLDVKTILNNASDPSFKLPTSGETTPPTTTKPAETTKPTESTPPTTTKPTEPTKPVQTTPPTTAPVVTVPPVTQNPNLQYRPDGYPLLTSQSGTYSVKNGLLMVDNSAFEFSGYNDSVASTYVDLVNQAANALAGKTKVYCLAIPKSIGVVVPDDIQTICSSVPDMNDQIEKVFAKLSSNVVPVRCFDNMMRHRNEYLYFRTDHHWNGIGAYYAYEAFCETKGVTPYTMAQREEVKYEGYFGTLYDASGKDPVLQPADTVYAYKPYSKSATMSFYQSDGAYIKSWPIISSAKNYNCFAASDQPLAIFQNPEVTDGSVCIVVKESFGNALLPYLVDHYSTIYEIDYRHWQGNLMEYAEEVGATDLIFANNIMMISTSVLVGKLADNIQ